MARRESPIAVVVALLVVLAVGELVRRRYFHGKLLDAGDLSEEQEYRRCRRHLH